MSQIVLSALSLCPECLRNYIVGIADREAGTTVTFVLKKTSGKERCGNFPTCERLGSYTVGLVR
jgi:hypothetical protein